MQFLPTTPILVYQHNPQPVGQSGELIATFEFRLPILTTGDYSIAVALADGSQESHVQHHWLHEALIVRVHASSTLFWPGGHTNEKYQFFSEIMRRQ